MTDPPTYSRDFDSSRNTDSSNRRQRVGDEPLSSTGSYSASPNKAARRITIDGRGSIDSRTFDETREISAVTTDKRDQSKVILDAVPDRTKWHSRSDGVATDDSLRPPSPQRSGSSSGNNRSSSLVIRILAIIVIIAVLLFVFIFWLSPLG